MTPQFLLEKGETKADKNWQDLHSVIPLLPSRFDLWIITVQPHITATMRIAPCSTVSDVTNDFLSAAKAAVEYNNNKVFETIATIRRISATVALRLISPALYYLLIE